MSLLGKRRRYYIHKVQKKYALMIFGILGAYTFILTLALFVPPSLQLGTETSLENQIEAASQYIALSDRLWPAILISIPAFMILSIFITHKLAGPIYRIEKTLKKMAEGDFKEKINFRAGDELQELGVYFNQIMERQDEVLKVVHRVHQELRDSLKKARNETGDKNRLEHLLEKMELEIAHLEALQKRINMNSSINPADEPKSLDH